MKPSTRNPWRVARTYVLARNKRASRPSMSESAGRNRHDVREDHNWIEKLIAAHRTGFSLVQPFFTRRASKKQFPIRSVQSPWQWPVQFNRLYAECDRRFWRMLVFGRRPHKVLFVRWIRGNFQRRDSAGRRGGDRWPHACQRLNDGIWSCQPFASTNTHICVAFTDNQHPKHNGWLQINGIGDNNFSKGCLSDFNLRPSGGNATRRRLA